MLSEYLGFTCQHRSDDFPIIVDILRERRPLLVIELGTDRGGFSALLADTIEAWCGIVMTFDIERKFPDSLLPKFPNLHFVLCDLLCDVSVSSHYPLLKFLVGGLCGTLEPVLLYCDNGNKVREIETYAPLLGAGSLLGVHDYGSEVPAEWCEAFVTSLGFEPEEHERMEALRNEWYEPMTRFWRRVR